MCPAILLNSFVSSDSIFGRVFRVFYIWIMPSAQSFTSSFPIWMPFISCLIPVAGTANTVLNKNGKTKHLSLVPDLRGKAFIFFTIKHDISCEFITYGFFLDGGVFPLYPLC